MKLELKHLAGYLPYGLKMYWEDYQNTPMPSWELKCDSVDFVLNNQNKPILHPLSDLTKEIEVNGEKFVPIDRMEMYGYYDKQCLNLNQVKSISFNMIQYLMEWHFDIYNLIENNLAIDINTINQ